jgi:hypothetical protein
MDPTPCEREIRSLHAFFESSFSGTGETGKRAHRALGPEFEMVAPDGESLDRETVLEGIEASAGEYGPEFAIEVRNLRTVDRTEDRCVVRYEEHQSNPDSARVSTAVFAPEVDAPEGVRWVHLHETWLPGGEPES